MKAETERERQMKPDLSLAWLSDQDMALRRYLFIRANALQPLDSQLLSHRRPGLMSSAFLPGCFTGPLLHLVGGLPGQALL